MRELSSKLNMYVKSVSVINNNAPKLTLNFILCSFGALALFYVFILGNMVVNIVERRGLEMDARTLANEVRDLEVTYLSMSSDVDLDLSHSLGFKETKAVFATRKALGLNSSNPSLESVKIVKNDL